MKIYFYILVMSVSVNFSCFSSDKDICKTLGINPSYSPFKPIKVNKKFPQNLPKGEIIATKQCLFDAVRETTEDAQKYNELRREYGELHEKFGSTLEEEARMDEKRQKIEKELTKKIVLLEKELETLRNRPVLEEEYWRGYNERNKETVQQEEAYKEKLKKKYHKQQSNFIEENKKLEQEEDQLDKDIADLKIFKGKVEETLQKKTPGLWETIRSAIEPKQEKES